MVARRIYYTTICLLTGAMLALNLFTASSPAQALSLAEEEQIEDIINTFASEPELGMTLLQDLAEENPELAVLAILELAKRDPENAVMAIVNLAETNPGVTVRALMAVAEASQELAECFTGCVDFEDPPLGTTYKVGDTFIDSGVKITVQPFQWSNGQWSKDGFAEVGNAGDAGGSGQEIEVNNVNLAFDLGGSREGISLLFGEYGGNLNININGDFRNFQNFANINGSIIGGVNVSVVNGFGNDKGGLKLSGTIKSFAIGGQELLIDDVTQPELTAALYAVLSESITQMIETAPDVAAVAVQSIKQVAPDIGDSLEEEVVYAGLESDYLLAASPIMP